MLVSVRIDIDIFLVYFLVTTIVIWCIYILIDVNYLLTNILIYIMHKIHKKYVRIDKTIKYYSICCTTDIDINYNMNNARYLRDLNFVRYFTFKKYGLYKEIRRHSGKCFTAASYIQYQKPISFLNFYKITTNIIYWDDTDIYLEHQFITLHNGAITTIILSKQTCIGINPAKVICSLLKCNKKYRPNIPTQLQDFYKLNKNIQLANIGNP